MALTEDPTKTGSAEQTAAPEPASPKVDSNPRLPLVSIVVVNYNFARFIRETLASVLAQTYPRIECIVVDNASTDGSVEIVEEMQSAHPDLRLLRRAANDGQTAASMDGIADAKGAYVILLDADDLLLPHCVSTHVRVHIASRVHVGFTCGDMLQMVDDQVVLSTGEAMAGFLRSKSPNGRLLRAPTEASSELWRSGGRLSDNGMEPAVYHVPRSQKKWVWSPTSGFCFRRDALALFCDNPTAYTLRSQTDLYLALGVNAVCGSILIDEPLFVYRLHGSNVFSNHAQMAGVLAFNPQRTAENTLIARRLLIDQLVSNIGRFVQEPWQAIGFLGILHRLDVRGDANCRWGSYVSHRIVTYERDLVKALGKAGAALFLLLAGASWVRIWRLAWRSPTAS